MTRTLSLSVAIALLAGLPQLQAGDPPAAPSPDAKTPRPAPEADAALKANADRFRSVNIVRDLAAFNILSLSSQKDGAWMVAGLYDGGSNSHNQGYYIEAETGKVIDRGIRPAVVLQVWGKWKRIELLSGEAPPEGRYQWKEPDRSGFNFDRSKSIYDFSPVFAGPDVTVICRFFEKKSGAEQFSSVTVIPDDWKTFVKPAYEYHVQHGADFADSDPSGLRKLAAGENPFIALTAIRHLLGRTTTAEETDQLLDVARSLPKYRQAVLMFWLLKRNDDKARDIFKRYPDNSDFVEREKLLKKNDENTLELVIKPVSRAISRANSAAELTGIALGIEACQATRGRMVGDSVMNLIHKVLERWQSFDRSTVADWQKILIAPGIPEGKAEDRPMPGKPDGRNRPGQDPELKKSAKEQYRIRVIQGDIRVIQGEEKGPGVHWVWVDQVVTLGIPFDVRAKNDGAAAKGVLERTKEGGLHFKGDVRMGYHVGAVDAPVELGKAIVPKKKHDTPLSVSGFVRFERPQPEGEEKAVKVLKKASDLSEKVSGGKDFSTGDQLLVVPGPRPAKQTPSQWFQDRLKADNALTADEETWLLYRSMQFSDYDRMSIERIEQQGNTFTVITNRAIYAGPLSANVTYHEVHGINLGKLPAGEYTVELIIRQSTFGPHRGLTPDPGWGELKEKFTVRATGVPEGKSIETKKPDGAKPSLEPRHDSKKEPKSSGFKERVRFNFSVHGPFHTEPIMDDVVTVNEPFNIRAKNGATATGVLRRTAEGGLHFKGEVSHSGRSAVFDAPVVLRMVELPKAGPGVFLGHLVSAQPRGAGHEVFDVGFSLSHVEEHVYSGLGLGVSGKRDQVIVVPGQKAEKQPPRGWFDSRLKADNVLTADQETWVLFRSKQLNRTLMWIERIQRDENTFTVTMNGPEATAGDDHYEVHGVNLGKLPTGTYEVKWIIRQSTSTRDKGPTGDLKENFTVRATGIPEGKSTQTNQSDGAKPPLEPRNDSRKQSKSSGFKERFRFNFSVLGPFQTEPIINDVVTVNELFNFRAKNGATATGVLRRTAEGGLHFKGEVSRGRSAVFDAELGGVELGKAGPGVLVLGPGRLGSVPKGGGDDELFTVGFSLSHVEEHVLSGLGRGVSGKQDQVIVVPGPQAEKQRPSEWFDSRLKAENVLTADQESWVLFRSKQLNRTLMWIERIQRDENTFTVTMNAPEATAGDDHYEVHGVNLGKLPTGTYEVKWIIRSGKGGSPPQDNKPAEPVELKSSFKVVEE